MHKFQMPTDEALTQHTVGESQDPVESARDIAEPDADLSQILARQVKDVLNQAVQLQNEGRLVEAEACYRGVIDVDPTCAAALLGLGLLASKVENHEIAYPLLKQAVTLEPENPVYWRQFARFLSDTGHVNAAVVAYENAIALKPDDADLLVLAAAAFDQDERVDQAAETYEKARRLDPENLSAILGLGELRFTQGDLAGARDCFDEVLQLDSKCPEALYRLSDLVESSEDLSELTRRISGALPHCQSDEKTARLHFASGKVHARLQHYDTAFEQFTAGNTVLRRNARFDREALRCKIDETIEAFQPEVFDALGEAGSTSRLPVFIVGMPRSGSTLVEQILSSHPDVADAGEFPWLWNITDFLRKNGDDLKYPRDIARFEPGAIAAMGTDYLDALRARQPQTAGRITDKLLENYLNLGLIRILFPDAAIIHCVRDPMSSCLSSYTQMYGRGTILTYTFDLADLGYYYRQYERLMDHWRSVLPNPMLEVSYEALVDNQEEVSRQLLDHVGLPWNEACLAFHETKRSVRTSSLKQVRQPIYRSSLESWRNYEKHLGPLRDALTDGLAS